MGVRLLVCTKVSSYGESSLSARKWFQGPRRQIQLQELGIDVVRFLYFMSLPEANVL